ncbi:MAG: hypothetical protein JST45_14575 [Bacteroidetes bacterium]|nr:hypothetical protein [Bacteroidota bacterium]
MRSAFWILTSCILSGAMAQPVPDTLLWSAARPLQATDFKMDPQSYSGLGGELMCMLSTNFTKAGAFAKSRFEVAAYFDRAKSWIDPNGDQAAMVAYFQVLFDIYELHARQLKLELEQQAPRGNPTEFMNARYYAAMAAILEQSNRFRKESRMGLDHVVVKQWKDRIEVEIASLPSTQGQ